VLRVAAEEVSRARERVCYFPAYEIVTAAATAHRYFEPDLRSVNDSGVAHVMRCFFDHFTAEAEMQRRHPSAELRNEISAARSVICDEEAIERALGEGA
jgi:hypothetical protein